MNAKQYLRSLLVIPFFVASCTYDFPEPDAALVPTAGNADFTKIVSVGNSLTAGFMNAALYTDGQKYSFAAILANQAKTVGGGEFNQPDINSENGYSGINGNTVLGRLYIKGTTPTPKIPGELPTAYTGDKTRLNNFGVPGITLLTALIPQTGGPAGSAAYNALYARFASNPGTSTVIGDAATALADGGTFFTFWLGNNDVLGYATGGGSNPATLTSNADFETRFNQALNAMLSANANAEGAVGNIPDVTSVPYFSTINPLSVTVPTANRPDLTIGIGRLNAAINGWNGGVESNVNLTAEQKAALKRPTLSTTFDTYPIIIFDNTLSDAAVPDGQGGTFVIPKIRNVKTSDGILLTLTASALLGTGVGISPLSPLNDAEHDRYYLTLSEIEEIQNSVNAFNATIAAAVSANSSRLVLVDINTLLKTLKAAGSAGLAVNGIALNATIFPPYGAFSLDGVHPNARGMAYIANAFITAINSKFNSNIPLNNPNDYPGNDLPIP